MERVRNEITTYADVEEHSDGRMTSRRCSNGDVTYYEGPKGEERVVLVLCYIPKNHWDHYEGAKGEERIVRARSCYGETLYFKGSKDYEFCHILEHPVEICGIPKSGNSEEEEYVPLYVSDHYTGLQTQERLLCSELIFYTCPEYDTNMQSDQMEHFCVFYSGDVGNMRMNHIHSLQPSGSIIIYNVGKTFTDRNGITYTTVYYRGDNEFARQHEQYIHIIVERFGTKGDGGIANKHGCPRRVEVQARMIRLPGDETVADKQTNEQTNEQINEQADEQTNEQTNEGESAETLRMCCAQTSASSATDNVQGTPLKVKSAERPNVVSEFCARRRADNATRTVAEKDVTVVEPKQKPKLPDLHAQKKADAAMEDLIREEEYAKQLEEAKQESKRVKNRAKKTKCRAKQHASAHAAPTDASSATLLPLPEEEEKEVASLVETSTEMSECNIPDELICSLSLQLMIDPVMTAGGHTYERASIERWLETHSTDPLTGENMDDKTLRPNALVRSMCRKYM